MSHGEAFGRILKERRRIRDMTQEDLAKRVGCAVVTIKKIEGNSLRSSKQIAELLAEALDIPAEERAAFVRLARMTPQNDRTPTPQMPLLPAEDREQIDLSNNVIKSYQLRERIGIGGFGAVYRADQPLVGRAVAIKIILPQYANHPDFIRRFETEAQIVARLEHPYIVPLYDYWREPGGAYLVMRYMRGGSLHAMLKHGPLSLEFCTQALEQITTALALAHRAGVIHRDIKPANILLDADNNTYLADFGIAKELGATSPQDQTQAGGIIGSPTYVSPEQIRDEPVTPQTDIYSLGILLYEMLTGAPPFPKLSPGELLQKQLHEPLPLLSARRPDLSAALNTVLQHATAKQPAERYADVSSFTLAVRQAISTGGGSAITAVSARAIGASQIQQDTADANADDETALLSALLGTNASPIENPYKGLRAFAEADAADFFGRAGLIKRILERLADEGAQSRFLAVVGPSGSGKSSVVKAGVIPALRRGGLPGSERWFVIEVLPGAHPLEELEMALLRIAVNPPPSLLEQLQSDERGLLRAIKRVLPADAPTELVLVIDQFEEVFTLIQDEAARTHFLNSLLVTISDPRSPVRVIITIRADFYDRPLLYPGLGELMRERSEVVLPLTPDELEQAIADPAARRGLTLDAGLITMITNDVSEQPGALPLLQYALTELFERRVGSMLTLNAYRTSGGVLGALARRADELYARLDPRAQEAARQLFLRLVTLGEGVEDTRRRVRHEELASTTPMRSAPTEEEPASNQRDPDVLDPLDQVIDLYGRYRLLTFDHDPITRGPTVEVAHEALIRTWGRLREWLDASRADLRVQRRLSTEAAEWASAGHDASFLARGARLAQFEALAADSDLALNEQETAYVRASIAERERQDIAERARQTRELELARQSEAAQRRAADRLRYLVLGLGVFLVVAIGLSVFAFNRQAAAVTNLTRSEAQRLAAEANALLQARGVTEVIGLLSIRSMTSQYSPQGDAALAGAATLDYPWQQYIGHGQLIASVAFSPNGKYVLTGSDDKTARLWNAQTGAMIRQFIGHTEGVHGVAFSPDGNYVLTGSTDKTARLWDASTGSLIRTFSGHTEEVDGVVFAPDGKYALTASQDMTARLWDVQTGKVLHVLSGHTSGVWVGAFSPDGKYVLTGSFDKTARLWDVQTGKAVHIFSDHTGAVQGVAFSPDGAYVATDEDPTIRLWDVQTGRELRQLIGHTNSVRNIAFSPDGRWLLSGSDDDTVRLWDVQTGIEVRRFAGHTGVVFSVAFSPDGQYALSGSLDTTALLWKLNAHPQRPILLGHTGIVTGVALSPDGRYALTSGFDKTARLWDTRTGEQRRVFSLSDVVNTVAFSPDGKQMLTGGMDQIVRLWDVESGAELRRFVGHRSYLNEVAFSPDGKYVLSGSGDREARLWDAQTGAEIRQFVGHQYNNIFSVAFSPDSRYALTGSYDGTGRMWDVETGKQIRTFTIPNDGAAGVAFSPDGKYVLTGSWDGSVRLWDAQTSQEVRRYVGHTGPVWDVAFSPDGTYILTGSEDRTARLWDVATGQELRRFTGHTAAISRVAFARDGHSVLTASSDGTARLWDVDYHDTIRYLCGRLLRDFTDEERAEYSITAGGSACPHP